MFVLAEMEKTASREEKWRWQVPDQEVTFLTCFGHVRFEMLWRHKAGDWKYNLKFRRKVQAGDINIGV